MKRKGPCQALYLRFGLMVGLVALVAIVGCTSTPERTGAPTSTPMLPTHTHTPTPTDTPLPPPPTASPTLPLPPTATFTPPPTATRPMTPTFTPPPTASPTLPPPPTPTFTPPPTLSPTLPPPPTPTFTLTPVWLLPTPTGTPLPMTPTAQPSPVLPIRSMGSLDIPQTWTVDLDEGVIGDAWTADIWFEAVTAVERYVTPRNGATIAIVGTIGVGPSGCAAVRLSTSRIPIGDLPKGTYVCVRTNSGHYSQFHVTAPVGPSPGTLSIEYITW